MSRGAIARLVLLATMLVWMAADARTQTPPAPSLQSPLRDPGPPTGGSPYTQTRVDTDWGELIAGERYRGTISLTSSCNRAEFVGIFTSGVPGLETASLVQLAPREQRDISYTLAPAAGDAPRTLEGEIVVWHPGSADSTCAPRRIVQALRARVVPPSAVVVSAHRARTVADAACLNWWARGQRPAFTGLTFPADVTQAIDALDAERCAAVARPLARVLVDRVRSSVSAGERDAWAWLPAPEALNRMSLAELTALLRRIEQQRAGVR